MWPKVGVKAALIQIATDIKIIVSVVTNPWDYFCISYTHRKKEKPASRSAGERVSLGR